MKRFLSVVLPCVLVFLPSCTPPSVLPSGYACTRLEANRWGFCSGWKGDEILYVLFLRQSSLPEAHPVIGGSASAPSHMVIDHLDFRLDGRDFSLDFTSATPDTIRIAGSEYRLSNGRVFLCGMDNETIVVKQSTVTIQRSSDYIQEMHRLAREGPVREFLGR
jgi:hypothetical protein